MGMAHLLALRRSARELRRALLDLVLPPHCPGCGAGAEEVLPGRSLCGPCEAGLEWMPRTGCPRCGEAVAELGPARCTADHRPLQGLVFAVAAARYRGTGGALVRRLKLAGDFGALRVLGDRVARVLRPRLLGPFRRAVLVPVPLHRARRRARGFDQAERLAQAVADRLGIEVVEALTRQRATLPQGDPRTTSRERNVEGAFAMRGRVPIAGRPVVLVDDVATSFATVRACAAVLMDRGASAVAVATACRARGL